MEEKEEKLPPPAYRPLRPEGLELLYGGDWHRRLRPTPMRSPEEVVEIIRKAKEKYRKRRET